MNDQHILIILGMHRSGTSLITQWLHKCGLHVGDRLMGSSESNKDGHFEDLDYVRLHEEILKNYKFPGAGFVTEQLNLKDRYYIEKLRSNVEFKRRLHNQWGWKDPRTCLFLDYYPELLPEAKYLVILRDYNEVVTSLIKRDFQEYKKLYFRKEGKLRRIKWWIKKDLIKKSLFSEKVTFYLKVWIWYNELLLKHLKQINDKDFLVVDYRLLFDESNNIFDILTKMWNFSLEYVHFNTVYKESLISSAGYNISSFLEDKNLMSKAEKLMAELETFGFNSTFRK